MKRILLAALIIAVVAMPAVDRADAKIRIDRDRDRDIHVCDHDYDIFNADDVSIDFEHNGTLVIECDEEDGIVEITKEYELYVNDKKVALDSNQQDLVREYYDTLDEIMVLAKEVGIEGAKIGVEGARIGIHAISCITKLLLEDYDEEDLDREMERESRKIEAKAEKLEMKAEKIEEMAEDFEDLHEELRDSVDELDDLGWF